MCVAIVVFVVFQNIFLRMTSFYERVLRVLNDDGAVCLLVCPGTKFCLQLQSFVLAAQNVAGTGGSGEGWILSRLGEKRLRAGLFFLLS